MIKLQRCPFCGHLAGYSKVPMQGFTVVCRGCGAIAMHRHATERDAIAAAWNQRVRQRPLSAGRLAPCPFCGGQIPAGGFAGDGSIIRCSGCGLLISFAQSESHNTSNELWNRRVQK